jgi:pimeloyl-ACP methyl ester carboxylesterase
LPTIFVNGTTLTYDDTGGDGPTVVFDRTAFAPPSFGRTYRVVSYDGADVDTAAALIKALGVAPCHYVGGLVGLELVARHPELLRSATVLSSPNAAVLLGELVGTTVPMLVLSDGDQVAQSIADTASNAHLARLPAAVDTLLADLFEAP